MGQATFLGKSVSGADNRIFVYEVEGLRQNEQTTNQGYAIRSSSTIQFQVPYNRMNEEMRRITRLGGKIVNIRPLAAPESSSESEEG
ncbi:phycobilisome linker polypeptide [Vacuolonema iberomarrocanum]|uniref:phycobilisome linker polypeptide n=1 Tax=Vacuolonema iberomarrocanum TaxID=3454632 RepID=UPI001A035492|nr:phycobilisome linker polypeptide [filamentous cyanobacterium LEGE 07170]